MLITLPNGVRVLTIQNDHTQTVSVGVFVNTVANTFNGREFNVEHEIEQIRAVTPAQVKKALKKILSAKKVLVVVGNKVDQAVLEKHA